MNLIPLKKYIKCNISALGLFLSLALQGPYAEAMTLEDRILKETTRAFRVAPTREEQFSIITQPISKKYFHELKREQQRGNVLSIDASKLNPDSVKEMDRTHPLALAICKAEVEQVKEFLTAVEDPNHPDLLVWGYRQPYNLVSLAADPVYPVHEPQPLAERLKIIDLLATTSVDFNFCPTSNERSLYHNTPLINARAQHGQYDGIFEEGNPIGGPISMKKHAVTFVCQNAIQARLMLYGADPRKDGSIRLGMKDKEIAALIPLAFAQALEEELDVNTLRPAAEVKGYLADYKTSVLENLSKGAESYIEQLQGEQSLDERINSTNALQRVNAQQKYLKSWILQ